MADFHNRESDGMRRRGWFDVEKRDGVEKGGRDFDIMCVYMTLRDESGGIR